ncbi:BCS1 N terminal-domain-containing protein [Hypomontagnella monticulosa]|nr:BCS1 N terminal-domain-containing protein [Hypomontagnella monticulosa]
MDYNTTSHPLVLDVNQNTSFTTNNASEAGTTNYATTVEVLLNLLGFYGLAPILGHIMASFGLNPRYFLTTLMVIWLLKMVAQWVYYLLFDIAMRYLSSSISIDEWDNAYTHLKEWLVSQPITDDSQHLLAETTFKVTWETKGASLLAKDRSGRYLNFSEQEAMTPVQYSPAIGLHVFWWKGRYFILNRKRGLVRDERTGMPRDRLHIVLSCLGRSTEPIKKLLAETQAHYYQGHRGRTAIMRLCKGTGRQHGTASWSAGITKPMRDIRTVVLDEKHKLKVLADINEYLHPATSRWYANRGIPLRRGYLFHGPPGTGKTSLSFALAGVFGLGIHVVSLLEPDLTETDLTDLFGSLPRRCIVLLEDIDAAGLTRPEENSSDDESNAKPPKARKNYGKKGQKSGISLSGLLNVIDGVAAHEGRVLIATTNYPEVLDPALIRPGRIDMQVAFSNATSEQAKELFIRMYEPDQSTSIVASSSEKSGPKATTPVGEPGDLDTSTQELEAIASEFGAKIPDGAFSPAEIQGYLLKRKNDPRKALVEADEWIEGTVKQKELRTNVMQAQ